MRPHHQLDGEQFRAAWPRVVRVLAAWSGSVDDAEEYAALAFARAVEQAHDGRTAPADLAAWCVSVAKRAWIDDHRRRGVLARLAPEIAVEDAMPPDHPDDPADLPTGSRAGLDDRLALLLVACDPALAPGAQLVLALRLVCGLDVADIALHLGIATTAAAARLTRARKALAAARPAFAVPAGPERDRRLPVVLDCVAGMFTVAHRTVLAPVDAADDLGASALSVADALVAAYPRDTEVRGLRAVVRLGLARRPGRVDADGVAVALDEADRSLWDARLLRAGLADATLAAEGSGRFALEAALAGLHSAAPSAELTDWPLVVTLYEALESVWGSPAVRVALLTARAQVLLRGPGGPGREHGLAVLEAELVDLRRAGPAYARRDAGFALADLHWRTGRRTEAAREYADLVVDVRSEPERRFCLRRAGAAED
ncbi:MAG: hypothetical protein JWR20_2362 [Marmoricola sp.]|nr:hypothetical protein [Marmoricola sp.]